MNAALWPGTWGYFLDAMLAPAVGDADVEAARSFFTTYVSGRGLVPAIQIGKQPYGILPTTAFSRLEWEERPAHGTHGRPDARRAFVARLDRLLRHIAADWAPLADAVPRVGAGGDPHQLLLDLVGLHPTSAEFHQRYLESLDDLHNRLSLAGVFDLLRLLASLGRVSAARALLERLGYEGRDPDILTKLLLRRQHALRGPLVDDRPLSESARVRAYTTDGRNYLTWLASAGRTSLDALRREEGFVDDAAPTALLYLMLRHALLVAWRRTGLRLQWSAGSIEGAALTQALREPSFVHVAVDAAGSESHWQSLYATDPQVTQDPQMPIASFIPTVLGVRPDGAVLHEALQAIERLQEVPTARLERLLAEHVDTCSYRLDAWRLGIVHQRLLAMRHGPGGDQPARPGIHLGVYGFLQEVRPKDRRLRPKQLEGALAETFNDPADPPLQHDELNGGHVLAPSLNHAAAAAILRSGYRARLADGNPGALAVKLTSERVRLATAVIDGLRNGQSLSALLGYRLERGLHDRHGEVEVDRFVFALRKAFPHRADRLGETRTGPGVPIEAVEARDVVDGLALVAHVSRTDDRTYPFGLSGLPPADAAQQRAIDAELERLLDVHDALGDLALAEGVYQAVLGNHERVASTLDAYAKAGFPPEPGVVETPRSGATLTQRVALHLRPGLSPSRSPLAGVPMTPRASAEPAVNEFLADVLPLPERVACQVSWTDPVTRASVTREVTQRDLGLQPVDLLRLVRLDDEAALGELDERVLRHVAGVERLRADVEPAIDYTQPIAGKVTFFELGPLIAHLRSLLGRSRPLRPSDAVPQSEATRGLDAGIETDAARPAALRTALQGIAPQLQALEADLRAPLEAADHAALAAGVDGFLERLVARFAEAGLFGVGGTGWGGLLQRRAQLFALVLTAVATVVRRFEVALREADELLRRDELLPLTATDPERIGLLMVAERLLTTTPTTPAPTIADPYRAVVDARRAAFVAKLDALRAVASVRGGLSDVLGAVDALLPPTAFDREGIDLRDVQSGVFELCADVRARAAALRTEIERRVAAAGERLAAHDAATAADARVDAIVEAARLVCGEDVVVTPQFTLGAEQADEWDAAMAWSRSGGLTAHLAASRSHPVEDWLHGVARVREKMRHWEQAMLLGGVIGRAEPELRPVQLPHASEPWLALELPPGHTLTGERLLYTAHYSSPFVKTAPQCGLLLDEWTEVVPGERETTGVAFNYDRPDSEPPQTMLLVTPPRFRGGWRWDDLVAALHETIDLARLRCVEPTAIDATPYAQLLPATVMAATVREVSISTNLARNNKLFDVLLARGDDA